MNSGIHAGYHTGHLLRRAQQLHHALWNQRVSSEVSSVQFAALTVLSRRPGISQIDLGDELDLDRSTIADLANRMTRNGLMSREQNSTDRRRKVLALTEAGKAALHELLPRVDAVEELLLESLTPEKSEALREAVLTMLEHGVAQGILRNAATPTHADLTQAPTQDAK